MKPELADLYSALGLKGTESNIRGRVLSRIKALGEGASCSRCGGSGAFGPMAVEAREPSTIPRPVCYLDDIAAQRLADSLYAAGFRPSEAMGSAGQREAIEAHLATVKGILDQTLPLALRRADE